MGTTIDEYGNVSINRSGKEPVDKNTQNLLLECMKKIHSESFVAFTLMSFDWENADRAKIEEILTEAEEAKKSFMNTYDQVFRELEPLVSCGWEEPCDDILCCMYEDPEDPTQCGDEGFDTPEY